MSFNITDGWYSYITSYVDLLGNLCIINDPGVQGCLFPYVATNVTSTNDIFSSLQSNNGVINLYVIGLSGGAGGVFTIHNDTVVGNTAAYTGGGAQWGIFIGEGSTGQAISPTLVYNNLVYGQNIGIGQNAPNNIFATSGTGGVGVYGNNVFGASGTNYGLGGGGGAGTNFDNGTIPHPSATYGDLSLDPKFVNPTRSWPDCDAILGGPGTVTNLFTQLFNRWNGTNPINYTAPLIYNCMTAPYAPREIRVVGKGALKPVLIFTGVQ
jgi:hypothetical protein